MDTQFRLDMNRTFFMNTTLSVFAYVHLLVQNVVNIIGIVKCVPCGNITASVLTCAIQHKVFRYAAKYKEGFRYRCNHSSFTIPASAIALASPVLCSSCWLAALTITSSVNCVKPCRNNSICVPVYLQCSLDSVFLQHNIMSVVCLNQKYSYMQSVDEVTTRHGLFLMYNNYIIRTL